MILTSLLCTIDDRNENRLLVGGYIKQKILNIDYNSKNGKQEQKLLFQKYRFDQSLIGVIIKYYFDNKNLISIHKSIRSNQCIDVKAMELEQNKNKSKSIANENDDDEFDGLNLSILLYKDPKKDYYYFSQLTQLDENGKLPSFNVYFYTLTGKRIKTWGNPPPLMP